MTKMSSLKDHKYVVDRVNNFTFDEACKAWKTKYQDYSDFQKEVITHDSYNELAKTLYDIWGTITPISVTEALQESNIEKRRVYFNCIGVSNLFKQLEAELLDKQVIEKERTRWDLDNQPYLHKFSDVYELYRIPAQKLYGGGQDRWGRTRLEDSNDAYAVRCWCTTTNREYWLYVPREAALGTRWKSNDDKPDAIRAIAWTIRLDQNNIEKIYRQGDIIVAKTSPDSRQVNPYHLDKDQYLNLMYSET